MVTTVAVACVAAAVAGTTAGHGVAAVGPGGYEVVDLTPGVSADAGGGFGQALGLGRNGLVVGGLADAQGNLEATLWTGASRLGLGTLGGSTSVAHETTDHALVVGESLTTGDAAVHAFMWRGGEMLDLGTLGGGSSWARGVERRGTVVGGAELADGSIHAFAWRNGRMADLGTLGGSTSWADAIGDDGTIVGSASLPGDLEAHAVT